MSSKPITPGPEQEFVWDYPRPPRLEPVDQTIRVVFNHITIATTEGAMRVLETSHPPTYYIPPHDIVSEVLVRRAGDGSLCEWKGSAVYYDVVVDDRRAHRTAWAYPDPTPEFTPIRGYVSFYASKMDACYVGEEQVQAQEGDFYGGWITSRIVGPFKGGPGTRGW